ncbi:MAG: hypothetical protein IPO65_17845 [Saprospiraceae bacterium]|nr:hypothetical protein [Saprospiraceae bacterium]
MTDRFCLQGKNRVPQRHSVEGTAPTGSQHRQIYLRTESLFLHQMLMETKDNNYLYNYKELNADHDLKWYDYGARFYDAVIGRWHVVDPMGEVAQSWTPYRYGFNNPALYLDPNGMSEIDFTYGYNGNGTDVTINIGGNSKRSKGTGVYRLNVEFIKNIEDDLDREEHFMSDEAIVGLNSKKFKNANEEGRYVRKNSAYFIGSSFLRQIAEIFKKSKKDNKERGFVVFLGKKGKELQALDVTSSKIKRGKISFDMQVALMYLPNNIKPIGTGHTHLINRGASSPVKGQSWIDFNHWGMKNIFSNEIGGYPLLIALKDGISLYITSQQRKYINPNLHPYYHNFMPNENPYTPFISY